MARRDDFGRYSALTNGKKGTKRSAKFALEALKKINPAAAAGLAP